jgi:hypothetical protein
MRFEPQIARFHAKRSVIMAESEYNGVCLIIGLIFAMYGYVVKNGVISKNNQFLTKKMFGSLKKRCIFEIY